VISKSSRTITLDVLNVDTFFRVQCSNDVPSLSFQHASPHNLGMAHAANAVPGITLGGEALDRDIFDSTAALHHSPQHKDASHGSFSFYRLSWFAFSSGAAGWNRREPAVSGFHLAAAPAETDF
jgi:hypothetical protein